MLLAFVAALVIGSCGLLSLSVNAFVSRPDIIPAQWNISYTAPGANISDGYVFLAQRGVTPISISIYTPTGDPVYFFSDETIANASNGAFNFRPQILNGEPVITFWEGYASISGYGAGHIIIMANNYTMLANVTATNMSDIHESRITTNNTMLSTVYNTVENIDVSSINPGQGAVSVLDGCFAEFSIPDSNPIFSFCSLEGGIPVTESFAPVQTDVPWDYIHVNSVDKDGLGNYLLSARHTSTLYYISGSTGQIVWRLGGKMSNFTTPGYTEPYLFSWQHDAQFAREEGLSASQLQSMTTRFISVYNNAGNGIVANQSASNSLILELNMSNMTAVVVTNFTNPGGEQGLLSGSQGSFEVFESDAPTPSASHALMGYGSLPIFAEWDINGTALQVVHWGNATSSQSYRAYKSPWQGYPLNTPDIALQNGNLYVSWNGATEVASWRVVTDNNNTFVVPRTGFETTIPVNTTDTVSIQAIALSVNGTSLASSQFIATNGTLLGQGAVNGTSQSTPNTIPGTTGSTAGTSSNSASAYSSFSTLIMMLTSSCFAILLLI